MRRVVIGLIGLVVVVAVAGGAFYGGMKVGQNQVVNNPMQYLRRAQGGNQQFLNFRGTPEPGQQGAARFGGTQPDTVQSVEGTTVIVNTQNGTVKVLTSDTTLIQKYTSVSVDQLEAGEQVIVSGSQNADGSITARSIRSLSGFQFEQQGQPTPQP